VAKPRTARDYDDDITAASRSGLAELMTILGSYRDSLVLIGGWAPYLILEVFGERGSFEADAFQREAFSTKFSHVGSIDIDLVVDPEVIDAERYATIVELLLDRDYQPVSDSLYQFERIIRSQRTGRDYPIRVDFLTPRPLRGEGRRHRHRAVQRDLKARTLEGSEVALGHWFWYELDAPLPAGGATRVRVKVTDLAGSLILKGLAIGDRYAEKDAYDIYALCAHYRGGPPAVAEALGIVRGEPVARRGLDAIANRFRTREAEGPTWVAEFLGSAGTEDHERARTDAFMTVQEVLRRISAQDG